MLPKRRPKPPRPVEQDPMMAAPVDVEPPPAPGGMKRPNQAPKRRPRTGKNMRRLPPV